MNILLINHYAGSPMHGMEYRPFYLAREWVRLGHSVSIVAASMSHLRTNAPQLMGKVREETIEGIRYIWLRTPHYEGNNYRRVLNTLVFSLRLITEEVAIIDNLRPDVVVASSPHPFIIYGAKKIGQKWRAQLVFEVRDLWPMALTEFNRISIRHPFIFFMQKAEDYSYRVADFIVSLLPRADEYMRQRGMAAQKFFYIPNGISADDWIGDVGDLPEEHKAVLQELKNRGRFLVGYTGYHGLTDTLYTLLDAASLLKDSEVSFILIGKGLEKENLMRRANQLDLKSVLFLPPVPKSAIPSLLGNMDALYIGCERNRIYSYGVSPNKLMDYLMAGKPIIQAIESANDLVAESGCGFSIFPDDAEAIAKGVNAVKEMSLEKRAKMGARGREYVMQNHDYRVLARRYLDMMSQELGGKV